MNERIQELHKQAVAYALSVCDADGVYQGREYLQVIREKFAELIVRECAETIKNDMELAHIQLVPIDFKMYANGRLQRTIKEHFGVE